MNTPLIVVLAAIAIAAGVVVIHNGIVSRRNAVRRAWADVLAYERQKQQTLPKLEELVGSYQEYERGLLTSVTQLRESLGRLGAQPDGIALAQAERASSELLKSLRIAVEAYPELQAAGALRELMAQLVDLQKEVTAALTIFSRNVELYNTGLETFPASLVNASLTRAQPVEPFTDPRAASAFDYRPRL